MNKKKVKFLYSSNINEIQDKVESFLNDETQEREILNISYSVNNGWQYVIIFYTEKTSPEIL